MTALALRDPALREIRLYGVLGRRFGRVHRLAVGSAREAVQALAVVVPGFARHLLEHNEPGYQVFLDKRGGRAVSEDRLDAPVSGREAICIVPVVAGAKRGGLAQVILGAALLFFAPYAAGALFGTGTAFGTTAGIALAKYGSTIGWGLIFGGVTAMLAPQPRMSERARNEASSSFGSGPDSVAMGVAVPITYGRVIVTGIPVSGGISTEELVPASAGGGGGGGFPTQPLPAEQPLDPFNSEEWLGA